MSEKTPIKPSDIRVGDRIRTETTDDVPLGTPPDDYLATEWIARQEDVDDLVWEDDNPGVARFLLDRPKAIIHEKGKTLYAVKDWAPTWFMTGDAVTVAKDYHDGDDWVVVNGNDYRHGSFKPNHFTDVKPETFVQVPQSAIDALRWASEQVYATAVAYTKNGIRRGAIDDFLKVVDA